MGFRRGALAPGLEDQKRDPGVRLLDAVDDVVARNLHGGPHPRRAQRRLVDPCHDRLRALDRRRVGQLHDRHEIALVLLGHEALRNGHEEIRREQAKPDEDRQQQIPDVRADLDAPGVAIGGSLEAAIEGTRQDVGARGLRAQEGGAKRRAERERVDARQRDGDGDRYRKLVVQLAGQPGDEGHRHEHGYQNQRRGDNRTSDLDHRLPGHFRQVPAALVEAPIDVLHDHDGIVHDQCHGHDQGEQADGVDGEAECRHSREGADQRHGHGDRRDQCASQVLQEHEDDQKHEAHGLKQRRDDLADGCPDEPGRVVVDEPGHILGELPGKAGHRRLDLFGDLEAVAVGELKDDHGGGGLAAERGRPVVLLRSKLDPRDVLDADHRAVGERPHHDVLELCDLRKTSQGVELKLERLAGRRRGLAERANRRLLVLFPDRGRDVGCGQPEVGQLGRIEPDPHRVLAEAKVQDQGDPGNPGERVDDMDVGVVLQEAPVVRAVR